MDAGTETQLIAVVATLSGVVLTLLANTYVERRRARDTRELESLRHTSEHATWLRDERLKAYAALSVAGEEVQQYIRSELPLLIQRRRIDDSEDVNARWRVLRTELRKAYNQVELFGADDARATALDIWRTARDAGNDLLQDITAAKGSVPSAELTEQLRAAASRLGTAGNRFVEACRADLQGD